MPFKNVGSGSSSIRDVARAAGVSVATASRVLAGTNYPVAPETREKVQIAARELSFLPNALARSLSRSRSESIGVVAPELTNPYYAAMVQSIDAMAQSRGYSMLLGLTGGDERRRESAIDTLLARRVDGLIVCAGADDHVSGRLTKAMGVPVALIGQQPNAGFLSIKTDNRRAGYQAAEHLWNYGHRRITYLTAHKSWHDFHDRGLGIVDFLAERGAADQAKIVEGLVTEAEAYAWVRDNYALPSDDTAIIAATDRHALSALAALSDNAVQVPAQVSVVGFDDYVTSQYVRPALTTVKMPVGDMGQLAVSMLLNAIDRTATNKIEDVSLQAKLVLRASTGPVHRA